MKKKDILKAIEGIKNIADDDEMAHSDEDALRESFIEYIATRKDSLGEKARLVLTTNKINFVRWYA